MSRRTKKAPPKRPVDPRPGDRIAWYLHQVKGGLDGTCWWPATVAEIKRGKAYFEFDDGDDQFLEAGVTLSYDEKDES